MKHLIIVSAPNAKPRQFELKGKRIGLGREVDNDITVNVDSVSSSHLEFIKTDSGYELVDLDSTNGTRVNGKIVQNTTLEDGDRILMGETVPIHFVILAEGEKYEAATGVGSAKDQATATEYASMSDKLEKLEANIEEKEVEAAKLDERLAQLQKDFAAQQGEHQKAQAELDKLQADIAAKKQSGAAPSGEMSKLEEDLMQKTQKVKLMANNLAAKQQTIEELEQTKAAATPAVVPPKTAGPVMPKAPAAMPRRPLPPGSPTVKLAKQLPNGPGRPPRIPKRPAP